MSVFQLLYLYPLQLHVLSEPVGDERGVFELISIGYVQEDADQELVHADGVHPIERLAHSLDVPLRLHLAGDVDAEVDGGDDDHDEVERADHFDDQGQTLRRRLLREGVEVAELGHARRRRVP